MSYRPSNLGRLGQSYVDTGESGGINPILLVIGAAVVIGVGSTMYKPKRLAANRRRRAARRRRSRR